MKQECWVLSMASHWAWLVRGWWPGRLSLETLRIMPRPSLICLWQLVRLSSCSKGPDGRQTLQSHQPWTYMLLRAVWSQILQSTALVQASCKTSPWHYWQVLQICSDMHQSDDLRKAQCATTPGVTWSVVLLHTLQVVQAHADLQYQKTAQPKI